MAQTLATAPATSLPWAWRLFRAPDSDDERFLIAFLHAQSQDPSGQDWNCDEVARTEDEARAYALQFGVSPSSFTNALEHLRARLAAGLLRAGRARVSGNALRGTPVVADGVLVAQDVDGKVAAFRLGQ